MALTDYTIDTSGTPQDVQRRQRLADLLMQKGTDTSPAAGGGGGGWITALNRGLAGALSGYENGQADKLSQANRQSERDLLASYPGLNGSPAALPVQSASPMGAALSKAAPSADTSGKIYNNDEPSPLDPPSGDDRTKMMATILGEENSQQGQLGVANAIRNRAVDGSYGGDTPSAVVTAKNQFEPWNTPAGRARMAAALQDPKQAAAADAAIKQAYGEGGAAPNDPTEGKTMFYSPGAQAALGRAAPSWAQGQGQMLGKTAFFDDNSELPSNSQPAQGQQPVQMAQADPQAAQRQALTVWAKQAAMSTNPAIRQMGLQTLEQVNKPRDSYTQETDKDGNIWSVNQLTGQRTIAKAAEKDPSSVQEFEYGQTHPDFVKQQMMKTKAGAASVVTNVDTKGPDKYDTVMGEGLAKSHAALSNGVEDAQSRARDLAAMQGAIDAIQKNGGATGGLGQAQALELAKTLNTGASAFGLPAVFDEKNISDKEFLTKFNRQIAGAQAKGAVGSRVTNFELSNYLKANPGLEMSTTGNQRLIGIQSQIEQRNVAVGNAIRMATAESIGKGERVNPASIQKIITEYDEAHHIKDPVTGQDLTQSYTLPEFQNQPGSSNKALSADHSNNMKKIGAKTYEKIGGVWHEVN